jgi:hypothetical protein
LCRCPKLRPWILHTYGRLGPMDSVGAQRERKSDCA